MSRYVLAKNLPTHYPFPSGQLKFFAAGTSNAIAVYSDSSGTVYADAGVGVININSNGRTSSPIFLDNTLRYKCQIFDSSAVLQNPVYDPIIPAIDSDNAYPRAALCAADSTKNALKVSISGDVALTEGLHVVVEIDHEANDSTTVTFQVNALTVKNVKKGNNETLGLGDIRGTHHFKYSATNDVWILLNPYYALPNNLGLEWKAGLDWQTGLVVDVTGTTYGYSVTAGSVLDSTGTYIINLTSSLTKAGGTTWAAGTSQGGKSNNDGAIAGNTVYKLYVVSKSSNPSISDIVNATSLAAALADTNVAAAGYNIGRCIFGYLRTNATPNKFQKVTCLGNNLYKFTGLAGGGDFAYDFETMTTSDVEGVVDIFAPPNHNAEVSCFMDNLAATTITIFAGEEIKGYFTPSTGGQFDSYISGSGVRIFRKLINSGASARAYVSLNKSGSGTVEVRINTQGFYHNLTALS